MKPVAILVPALLLASEAAAISRYQTTAMSCTRLVAALDAEGSAILRYPSPNDPSIQLYDRYVRDDRQCSRTQRARKFSVPTADNMACPVRKCVRVSGAGNR